MKGTDLLKKEHQVILRGLKILDTLCTALEKKQKVPLIHLEQITNFMTVYANHYHHGKEANILLHYIDTKEIMEESTDAIPSPKFMIQARNLIGLLNEHILKEDNFFLPDADQSFTGEQQEELCKKLITSETENDKKQIEKLCNIIDQLEKIYVLPQPSC